MKAIIEGKRYDTETATFISEWDNGLSITDFSHAEESLYRTSKGAYFLAGEGGALSVYSQRAGNAKTGGSKIRPLTEKGAFLWLCEAEFYDLAEATFPKFVTDA